MKNFVQPGQNVTVTAPAGGVTSGDPVMIEALFGVATREADAGETVVIATTGVYTLPKTSTDDIAVGAAVYFDSSAGEVTLSDGSGSNPMVGHAVTAAGNPSATVAVRLRA
jgi:predicted RecA/RadA family phage recombinase